MFTELESDIDWLTEKEGEFKTQPLLTTTVEDVEANILQHQVMMIMLVYTVYCQNTG